MVLRGVSCEGFKKGFSARRVGLSALLEVPCIGLCTYIRSACFESKLCDCTAEAFCTHC